MDPLVLGSETVWNGESRVWGEARLSGGGMRVQAKEEALPRPN